ncbi:hypothetical protein QAD02_021939 [Eretmocerus hayati]|uniref:Uncharacterized protein n=1 Tax=Eretmocerus hayati TaxID=131215 RepID=A0ACC2PWG3_9HYME|nr:hypothetical protein QAD02_021939 [Eretmocerus hayati]
MQYLINISDLVDHVGKPEEGSQKYVEGQRVANANHLMYVGITAESEEKIDLLGLCLQTTDFFGTPRELNFTIVFEKDSEKREITSKCSCAGGALGICKHVMAMLIYLIRTKKENIDKATCTDIKQTWGKLKSDVKAMYETVPFEKMCHLKPFNKKGSYKANSSVCPSLRLQVFKNLVREQPGSLISTLETGHGTRNKIVIAVDSVGGGPVYATRSDCKKSLDSKIYLRINNNVCLFFKIVDDLDLAVDLCIRTKTQSGEAWKWERIIRISASIAYYLYTAIASPHNKNKVIDWDSKILKHLNNQFHGNDSTAHGIKNEPKARACYEKKTGYAVTQLGSLVHPDVSWLHSSLDGIVFANHDDRISQSPSVPDTPSVPSASSLLSTPTARSALGHTIEIKCPELGKTKTIADVMEEWPCVQRDEHNVYYLKKKHKYFCQVQLGMFISGMKKCDFIVYSSFDDTCHVIEIPYDEDLTHEYVRTLQFVYFSKILKHISAYGYQRLKNSQGTAGTLLPRQAFQDISNK